MNEWEKNEFLIMFPSFNFPKAAAYVKYKKKKFKRLWK